MSPNGIQHIHGDTINYNLMAEKTNLIMTISKEHGHSKTVNTNITREEKTRARVPKRKHTSTGTWHPS